MSTSIDQAFVQQFESEVHEAYQRRGSKLRNAVRTKTGVKGGKVTFPRIGKGAVSTKTRHGQVPTMNIAHDKVECTLVDWYGGEWVDKLDELKTNIPERKILANAGAYAMGRKTDDLILEQLAGITESLTMDCANVARFRNGILDATAFLNSHDVPADDERWGVVSPRFWSWMMCVPEFVNADYIGPDDLPYSNPRFLEAKRWLGVNWVQHTGVALLPVDFGTEWPVFTVRGESIVVVDGVPIHQEDYDPPSPVLVETSHNLLFHKTAIGHAVASEVETNVTWHGTHGAHFILNTMSQASVLIDPAGGIRMLLDETVPLATS